MTLAPLFFAPVFKEKVWGGTNLKDVLGKAVPNNKVIGESWELSGYPTDVSTVASGVHAGKTLDQVIAIEGKNLLGTADKEKAFPLLYKFIDAQDKLSIQVHPDDVQAKAHNWGHLGKTECWYIISTAPNAEVICGFNREVSANEVRTRLGNGTFKEILNIFKIQPGDVINVPAGTVHANQPGTFLYEVQQTSDTTLRLYDWDRNDPNRKLHIEESLGILDYSHHDRHKIPAVEIPTVPHAKRMLRIACAYFAIEEYSCEKAVTVPLLAYGSFRTITVLKGSLNLESEAGKCTVGMGDTVLVPASLTATSAELSDNTQFLVSWVPDLMAEVIKPLRSLGISDSTIELLGGNVARNDLLPLMK